jgi:hypothetical protein
MSSRLSNSIVNEKQPVQLGRQFARTTNLSQFTQFTDDESIE